MTDRPVTEVHPGLRHVVMGLETITPLVGPPHEMLDPFLLLNHHGPHHVPAGSPAPPPGPHPHRGFETITFVLQGEGVHADSIGNRDRVRAGGVQWLTAGSGVVHAETAPDEFWRTGGTVEALQLWVNLPTRLKMTSPRYASFQPEYLAPLTLADGAGVMTLVSGAHEGVAGPAASLTGLFLSTLSLKAGAQVAIPTPSRRRVLFYVLRGALTVNGAEAGTGDLVRFADGDRIVIDTRDETFVLFGHADAIDEPVAASGPFVMNTAQEVDQAWRDYYAGRFGTV